MPFLPCLALLFAWVWSLRQTPPFFADTGGSVTWQPFSSIALAWVMTFGVHMLFTPGGYIHTVPDLVRHWSPIARVRSEIRSILDAHRGESIGMAYGTNDTAWISSQRYELAYQGQPYVLDLGPMQDLDLGGVTVPESTIQYLASCATNIWLVPANSEPFLIRSNYTGQRLFSDRFRQSFLAHYSRSSRGQMIDLWSCRD
jgi:hypothetical protein